MRCLLLIFLVAAQAQGASFYPWEAAYGLWLPPTLRAEGTPLEFSSAQYPFALPQEAVSAKTYQPLSPTLTPETFLTHNIAFFAKAQQEAIFRPMLAVGNKDYELPSDFTLDEKTLLPFTAIYRVGESSRGLYPDPQNTISAKTATALGEYLSRLPLSEGLYPLRLYFSK